MLLCGCLQDTSCTAAAQAKRRDAATAVQQHAAKVQQLLQVQPTNTDANCWQQVQTAAHHLLSTYRAASLRLQLLSSQLEAREKLLQQIREAQQATGQLQDRQSAQAGSTGGHGSSVLGKAAASARNSGGSSGRTASSAAELTAFELHLVSHPPLLQQHQQALQQACSLLQQQLQCVQAAQTFFAWAASVLQEDQKQAAAAAAAPMSGRAGSRSTVSSQANHIQQQQRPPGVLLEPSVAELLPLVQQLPSSESPLAAQVLLRIMQQLPPELATSAAGADCGKAASAASAAASLGGLSLAGKGSLAITQFHQQQPNPPATGEAVSSAFISTAAAALVETGVVPGPQQELLQLPDDIVQLLQNQQQDSESTHPKLHGCQEQQQLVWQRRQVSKEQLLLLARQLQAQQQKQQACTGVAAGASDVLSQHPEVGDLGLRQRAAGTGSTSGAAADVPVQMHVQVPVSAELQRLHGLALHMAKQLAKVRAANKQQLQVARELLLSPSAAQEAGGGSGSGSGSSSNATKLVMFRM